MGDGFGSAFENTPKRKTVGRKIQESHLGKKAVQADLRQTKRKADFEKFVENNFDTETFDISARHGFMGIVNKKTKLTVGEKGKAEHVNIFDIKKQAKGLL